MNNYLELIDRQIAAKHLLAHPFYLAWERGELTARALADYACQYYQHVAAFPTYISAVYARCEDQATRRHLLSNLIDEERGEPNHAELWLQFAEALGVSREEVLATQSRAETAALIKTFQSICEFDSTTEGLAALYAYESQIPAVSISKIEGLIRHYGFSDPKSYRYFTVHIEADCKHAAAQRALLAEQIEGDNATHVQRAIKRVLAALSAMLSGICRQDGVAC